MMKYKKIPMRTCVVSLEKLPKKELIRIVRNKEGEVFVDPTGKLNGRGVYLKLDENIINKARELEVSVPDKIYEDLLTYLKENKND